MTAFFLFLNNFVFFALLIVNVNTLRNSLISSVTGGVVL